MADNKQGGGNPPFIAQTEEYSLQNDVGRHTTILGFQREVTRTTT